MKPLIAVVTCHAYRHRADAQRATWVSDAKLIVDVKFFIGGGVAERADEVVLDVDDGYKGLPAKTQAVCKWALANGYTHLFKCDDDTYVRPERLLASGFQRHDYAGRLRGSSGNYPAPYASGFSYWLSERAMKIIAEAPLNGDVAEDRFVGNTLLAAGIHCQADYRYVVITSKRNARSGMEAPRRGNPLISACEFERPEQMVRVHEEWKTMYSQQKSQNLPFGRLDRVCVMIKTFLRDGYLAKAIEGLQHHMPEAKMIILDDGYESRAKIELYAKLRRQGHACINMPFDSGFGAKSNAAIEHCDREYMLVGSDDFDFTDEKVRDGVERLLTVMDNVPELGIASGRVDGRKYEGFIERGVREDGTRYIKEHPLGEDGFESYNGVEYKLCDLTVNYSLLRRRMLGMDKVHWYARWKIGGDHFTFFDDARKAGWKIALVKDVNINQIRYMKNWQHSAYNTYRARAKQALPSFFEMQEIDEYIGFDGRVDRIKNK